MHAPVLVLFARIHYSRKTVAERTTPVTVTLFSGAGGADAVESGGGRPQPMTKRPATVRQSAATPEIAVANSYFFL